MLLSSYIFGKKKLFQKMYSENSCGTFPKKCVKNSAKHFGTWENGKYITYCCVGRR